MKKSFLYAIVCLFLTNFYSEANDIRIDLDNFYEFYNNKSLQLSDSISLNILTKKVENLSNYINKIDEYCKTTFSSEVGAIVFRMFVLEKLLSLSLLDYCYDLDWENVSQCDIQELIHKINDPLYRSTFLPSLILKLEKDLLFGLSNEKDLMNSFYLDVCNILNEVGYKYPKLQENLNEVLVEFDNCLSSANKIQEHVSKAREINKILLNLKVDICKNIISKHSSIN